MNAPAPALDRRAIGLGAAVGIGGSVLMSVLWMLFPLQATPENLGWIVLASHALGAVVDIATGATAGWLAGRRGSMHGLLAGVAANLVAMVIGYALTLARTGYGRTVGETLSYLAAMVPWQIVGIALATIAGAIAVRVRARTAA